MNIEANGKAPSNLGIPNTVWILAIVYPLVYSAINLSWYPRAGEGWRHTGFLQSDQHLYTAYAREVFERGNGLFYANPHDADPGAPRIFTNLGYLMLAWTKAILRTNWISVWELLRFFGGAAMVVLLYRLMAALVDGERRRLFFWALALTGGGVAWLLSLPDAPAMGWLDAFIHLEDGSPEHPGYGWWLLNVFRQGLYPLETLYHALLYGTLLAWLARRPALTLLLLFLLWWTHPITALLGTTIVAAGSVVELAFRSERRAFHLIALGGAAIVAGAFGAYNRFYVASFPSGKSLIDQTLQTFDHSMKWSYVIPAFGFFLLAPVAALAFEASRRFLFGDPRGRLILIWFVSVFLWTHNDWFLKPMIQPLHFARGHLMLALVLLAAAAARAVSGLSLRVRFSPIALAALLGVPLVAGAMDNVFFLARLSLRSPKRGFLILAEPMVDVFERLNELPPMQTILWLDPRPASLIPSLTPHLCVLGDVAMTPFCADKARGVEALFKNGDPAILNKYRVGWLVADVVSLENGVLTRGLAHFELKYTNGYYAVFKRKSE